MAILVLRRGTPARQKYAIVDCMHCRSQLACQHADGTLKTTRVSPSIDDAYIEIKCPVCNHEVVIDPRLFAIDPTDARLQRVGHDAPASWRYKPPASGL